MSNSFYLGAYGKEENIYLFHESLRLPMSEVKNLKVGWHWHSSYNKCASLFPEDELENFLSENRLLVKKIKKHRGLVDKLIATIVYEWKINEKPQGYSISPRLIQLLAEINASLEIDILTVKDCESVRPPTEVAL